ncbi:MAG: YqgE/AlgH family protein [Prolixibacteraceae bacterium]|nr:YqgE/AlgH family protein [Prolixibacteraceae bacterium]
MNTGIFKIETNHIKPKKGRILVAEPFLAGSYFNRAVVLLAAHDKDGSIGFILNKKVSYSLNEVVKNFPDTNSEIFIGGSVNSDSLYYIHTLGEDLPGSIKINDNIYWGRDIGKLGGRYSLWPNYPEDPSLN